MPPLATVFVRSSWKLRSNSTPMDTSQHRAEGVGRTVIGDHRFAEKGVPVFDITATYYCFLVSPGLQAMACRFVHVDVFLKMQRIDSRCISTSSRSFWSSANVHFRGCRLEVCIIDCACIVICIFFVDGSVEEVRIS